MTHVKWCKTCGAIKSVEEFDKQPENKDGRCGSCKLCRKPMRQRHEANRKRPIGWLRKRHLKATYGISVETFNAMLLAQDGRCAICATKEPGGRYNVFHIDHDHTTNTIRGLLCHNCNVALAKVGDNLAGVMRFVNYLNRTMNSASN